MDDAAPSDALAFGTTFELDASTEALAALAVDLERLMEIEPRLRAARWVSTSGPASGAEAEIECAVRFRTWWVSRAVGSQVGTLALEEYRPPNRLVFRLTTASGTALLAARLDGLDGRTIVATSGWLRPHSAVIARALSAWSNFVRRRVERAIRREASQLAQTLAFPAAGSQAHSHIAAT